MSCLKSLLTQFNKLSYSLCSIVYPLIHPPMVISHNGDSHEDNNNDVINVINDDVDDVVNEDNNNDIINDFEYIDDI